MSDQVFGAHDAHHRIRTAISAESVATTGAPAGVPLSSGGVTSSHCDASLANLLALCIPILKGAIVQWLPPVPVFTALCPITRDVSCKKDEGF